MCQRHDHIAQLQVFCVKITLEQPRLLDFTFNRWTSCSRSRTSVQWPFLGAITLLAYHNHLLLKLKCWKAPNNNYHTYAYFNPIPVLWASLAFLWLHSSQQNYWYTSACCVPRPLLLLHSSPSSASAMHATNSLKPLWILVTVQVLAPAVLMHLQAPPHRVPFLGLWTAQINSPRVGQTDGYQFLQQYVVMRQTFDGFNWYEPAQCNNQPEAA